MELTPLQWKLSAICKFTEKLCFASNVEISLAASDLRFPLMSCAKSQDEHSTSIESAKAQFLPMDFRLIWLQNRGKMRSTHFVQRLIAAIT